MIRWFFDLFFFPCKREKTPKKNASRLHVLFLRTNFFLHNNLVSYEFYEFHIDFVLYPKIFVKKKDTCKQFVFFGFFRSIQTWSHSFFAKKPSQKCAQRILEIISKNGNFDLENWQQKNHGRLSQEMLMGYDLDSDCLCTSVFFTIRFPSEQWKFKRVVV